MTARTAARSALALLALCALLLAGCGAQQTTRGSNLSLMERYHSGKDLLHDGEGEKPTPQGDAMNAQEHLQRGMAYLAQNRPELAFEQFSRACQLDPRLAEARYQRGALLVARGAAAEARPDIDAALTLAPDNARAWETAGMLSFAEGNLTEAGTRFERALALDPRLAGAASHLGAIHNYQGHPDKALALYLRALELLPRSGELHNNAGIAQAMLGNDAAAVDHFRAAITYGAPGNRVWNNMGLSLCRLGRYDEAFEAFRNAGGEAAAHNNLGVYLSQQGEHTLALYHLQRALEVEPRYYARAAENLKRARLAARIAQGQGPASPTAAPLPMAGPGMDPAGFSGATGGTGAGAVQGAPGVATPVTLPPSSVPLKARATPAAVREGELRDGK